MHDDGPPLDYTEDEEGVAVELPRLSPSRVVGDGGGGGDDGPRDDGARADALASPPAAAPAIVATAPAPRSGDASAAAPGAAAGDDGGSDLAHSAPRSSSGNGDNRNDHGNDNDNGLGGSGSGSGRNLPNDSCPEVAYYTAPPLRRAFRPSSLSFRQRLREYRHSRCLMTPVSALVLLAVLVAAALGLLLTFPQFLLGALLGPLLRRNFWLVEFLYRYEIAKWGHVKIMELGEQIKNGGGKSKNKNKKRPQDGSDGAKKRQGHSATLRQRITVVPGRVFVHLIPQFADNVAYLIVCAPPPDAGCLPLLAVLVDCGQAPRVLQHMELIYEEFYARDYPRRPRQCLGAEGDATGGGARDDAPANYRTNERVGMELHLILCTHRHHDHTAGVGELKEELASMRREQDGELVVSAGYGGGRIPDSQGDGDGPSDVYQTPGKTLVVGGAVEEVPHCDLFVKNGCFVPLPCISTGSDGQGSPRMANDMNAIVSLEVIGVPSHTRGSVVYALRNRAAPGAVVRPSSREPPLQSHLFTGDAVFTGGSGVPFEADLERESDNFAKHRKGLQTKHGGSSFRPGAGTLSVERCFAEVLSRARGPWSRATTPGGGAPPAPETSPPRPGPLEAPAATLLYPGHEYTTDLLLRQFDPRTVPADGSWPRLPPAAFFATASHYFVSAHRRALPPGQKLPTLPTPLEVEVLVNPHFRSLKRRGEGVVRALRLWYEFGAENSIAEGTGVLATAEDPARKDGAAERGRENKRNATAPHSVFTTVYSADLDKIAEDLRSGETAAADIADRLEALPRRLDERTIPRRPIPGTLPIHKTVYLGVVALAVLGAAPSGVTASDAAAMGLVLPVENSDRLLVSRQRLIDVLESLGLLSDGATPRLQDIISLLWWEARLDDGGKLRVGTTSSAASADDIERSLRAADLIELGLLKLALFGVACRQPSKFCLPCGGGKPQYDEGSWVTTSKLRRTGGELVRHDPETCPLCRGVLRRCPYSAAGGPGNTACTLAN